MICTYSCCYSCFSFSFCFGGGGHACGILYLEKTIHDKGSCMFGAPTCKINSKKIQICIRNKRDNMLGNMVSLDNFGLQTFLAAFFSTYGKVVCWSRPSTLFEVLSENPKVLHTSSHQVSKLYLRPDDNLGPLTHVSKIVIMMTI